MCYVGGEHTREWVYARVVQALKRATKRPLKLTLHRAMSSHDTGASPLVSISQTRLMAPPGTRAELLDSSFVRVGDDAGLRRVAEALGAVALQPAEFAMRHVLPRVETLPMELREAAMATVACLQCAITVRAVLTSFGVDCSDCGQLRAAVQRGCYIPCGPLLMQLRVCSSA